MLNNVEYKQYADAFAYNICSLALLYRTPLYRKSRYRMLSFNKVTSNYSCRCKVPGSRDAEEPPRFTGLDENPQISNPCPTSATSTGWPRSPVLSLAKAWLSIGGAGRVTAR